MKISLRVISFFLSVLMAASLAMPAMGVTIAVVSTEELPGDGMLVSEDGSVSVRYGTDAGIPEGSFLDVCAVEDDRPYRIAVENGAQENEKLESAFFRNISIRNASGEPVEPKAPVRVTIALPTGISENSRIRLIHFPDEGSAADEPTLMPGPANLLGSASAALSFDAPETTDDADLPETVRYEFIDCVVDNGSLSFDAAGFSVYALVSYTVDFGFDVSGKTFAYSIAGGAGIGLSELLPMLGVVTDDPETEENEVRDFVEKIENVSFTDPDRIWVGKADHDTTIGALIEENRLSPEVSADLPEEKAEAFRSTPVQAGDWVLISLQPFSSEEKLIISMNNGETFVIEVTDEQPSNPFGLGGKTFVIVNNKYNTYSALTSAVSSSNNRCLAGTSIQGLSSAPASMKWTFEYTGTGNEFLIHDQNGKYLVIGDNSVYTTADIETAAANPIIVTYDNGKDKYSFKAKNSSQGLNNYGGEGFGRWGYDVNNNDFWMELRNPDSLSKPGLIDTADTRAEGIVINLFDYGPDSLDLEKNTNANDGKHSIVNEGINKNHILKFVSHGTEGSGINNYTGGTDEGGATGTTYRAMQGIVQPSLYNGYPVLTGYDNRNGSLQYLFDPDSTVEGKTVYKDVNHLFTVDDKGYYEFDSNKNYAYYDISSSNTDRNFIVYANSFNEEGTVKNEKVGFFPFDDYNSYYNCIHGGAPNDQEGFGYYNPHWDDRTYRHFYLDKLGHYNHHFGVSMTADFVMTKDGTYKGEDMTFSFSGDDDMWVFVDGVLVLDIGGIHNPVSGSINFRTGAVDVSGKMTVDSTGAVAGPTSIQEAFSRVTGKEWDDSPFSSHKLQVFYMERGGMYSNCKIGFNLPTYKTLSLAKKLRGLTDAEREKYKDEVFHYEVIVNGEPYNGNDTIRMNREGQVIEEGFPIVNGQVSIKDGETVTITGLKRTDTFYAAEEKSLNMEQFEEPHAERNYVLEDETVQEEEIVLTSGHTEAEGVDLDDWKTPTYRLENTERVTFTNSLKEKNLEVEKKWEGEKEHPDEIRFTVIASVENEDGVLEPYSVSVLKEEDKTTDRQFTLSESGKWRTLIEHLPVETPDGKMIYYEIEEAKVEGYVLSGAVDLTAEEYHFCNVDAVKLWPDQEQHSEVITVRLKNAAGLYYAGTDAQGNAVFGPVRTAKTYPLNQANDFTHCFMRLPAGDTYTVEQVGDQDDHTHGLVTYVRNIIQYQLVNTPTGGQVDPGGPQDNPEIHKCIDALRDGVPNPDSPHTDEDLTDLYRLYLDFKVNSLQEASGVDLLFVIDHSGSMNNPAWQGNRYRAPAVMAALNGENGLISDFLDANERNQWAAVGFKGPDGAADYFWSLGAVWPPRTERSLYNAGLNGSEVLSPGGTSYIFTRQDASPDNNVTITNEGANILTNYTAGLWRAEQFLTKQDVVKDGRKKVVVFISDGIPTLHIDCGNHTLQGAGEAPGSYYYRDQNGGCPEETLVEFGYFVGDMTRAGYVFGENMDFYTIGFGGIMQTAGGLDLLNRMLDAAYGEKDHSGHLMTIDDTPDDEMNPWADADYSAATNKLREDLRTIMGMNETFSGIEIRDDLSEYVDLFGAAEAGADAASVMTAAKAKVTMTVPDPEDPTKTRTIVLYENGAPADADNAKFTKEDGSKAAIIDRLEYDSSSKTVKAVFAPEYEAVPGVTYTLSFDVKATDKAYTTYRKSGYDKETDEEGEHVIQGDPDTDFLGTDPVNATSVRKDGFHSNDGAAARYLHNGETETKTYPHPVIQVSTRVRIVKENQGGEPLENARFTLYDHRYDPAASPVENAEYIVRSDLVSRMESGEALILGTGLEPGTYYLVETAAPDGYNPLPGPVMIVVTEEHTVSASLNGNSLSGKLSAPDDDSTEWKLRIPNTSGYALPSTGGPGGGLLTAFGTLTVLASGAALTVRSLKKRGREEQ